ncbi:hypothetical protein BC940DRAFT_347439, partial [Gongronella butleri]
MSKVALVTGCTRGGIGYYTCLSLQKRGFKVYATARKLESMEGLEGKTKGIDNNDMRLTFCACSLNVACEKLELDVGSTEQIEAVVKTIIDAAGRIDVLVNNAGVPMVGPLVDLPRERALKCLDINVLGPLTLARAVAPHMVKQGSGTIVNIGSVAGYTAFPFGGMYAASKAALHSMSDALRIELAPFGIHVMIVAPGAIRSNIGNNSEQGMVLPEDSMYQSVASFVKGRATLSQGPHSTPTDEFAELVVKNALKSHPPRYLTAGAGSWTWLVLSFMPRFVMDWMFTHKFGLNQVKVIKAD